MFRDGSPGSPLLDRRAFLRTTALGSAALAATAVLPTACAPYHHLVPQAPALAFLSVKEFAILREICETILPGGGGPKPWPAASEMKIAEKIDAELAKWPEFERGQVKQLLLLWEHGTLFLGGGFRRFTKMSAARKAAYASGWERSGSTLRRTGFMALKTLAVFFYYTQPATWDAVGYSGPWIDWTPEAGIPPRALEVLPG